MRLALFQPPSPAGDAEAALTALEAPLRAAAAMGAGLLLAPETFLPGYNCGTIPEQAQPRGGDWHRRLAGMARAAGCGLALGYAERAGAQVFNAAVVFDATGAERAHYRKVQLYGPREKAIYAPGEAYCTFTLAGRRLGLLICYDVEFAGHIAALAARGVEAVLVPTANMLPYTHVAQATVPAMAASYGLAIAYANLCGTEGDLAYAGGSVIVGHGGEVLAKAGPGPALLVTDLPPPAPRSYDMVSDFRNIG